MNEIMIGMLGLLRVRNPVCENVIHRHGFYQYVILENIEPESPDVLSFLEPRFPNLRAVRRV